MKTKWYNVTVQATKEILVEVEVNDEDDPSEFESDAVSVALGEAFSFCEDVEALKIVAIPNEEKLEQAKRWADEVFPLD